MNPTHLFGHVQHLPGSVWLDGGDDGRSILAWSPVAIREGDNWREAARELTEPDRARTPDDAFQTGCLGYIGYPNDFGLQGSTPEPSTWLARYERSVTWNKGQWKINGPKRFHDEVRHYLHTPPPVLKDSETATASARAGNLSRDDYMRGVETIRDWIRDGDCYQVNLTRAVHLNAPQDPWNTYRRLRTSAAEYGAFLRVRPDLSILCNSPELLLRVVDGHCLSVPIKGTSSRHADIHHDRASHAELLGSAKDQAELNMIVDLVRNDLGRVSQPGTVLAEARTVTGHTNVWHGSQRVHSILRPNHDSVDALDALFPPGSVTGAPKRRACQRIAELETEPRGVYCGAIGYLSDTGSGCFNVAIRTAIQQGDSARYHIGGGIVYGSDPAQEWRETMDKARELSRAFGA